MYAISSNLILWLFNANVSSLMVTAITFISHHFRIVAKTMIPTKWLPPHQSRHSSAYYFITIPNGFLLRIVFFVPGSMYIKLPLKKRYVSLVSACISHNSFAFLNHHWKYSIQETIGGVTRKRQPQEQPRMRMLEKHCICRNAKVVRSSWNGHNRSHYQQTSICAKQPKC